MNWWFIMFVMTWVDWFLSWRKMITKLLVKFDCWKSVVTKRTWLVSLMGRYIQWFWSLLLRFVFFTTHWFCNDVLNNYFIWDWLRGHIMWELASKWFWNILIDHRSWSRKLKIFVELRNLSFWRMRFFSDQVFISKKFLFFR